MIGDAIPMNPDRLDAGDEWPDALIGYAESTRVTLNADRTASGPGSVSEIASAARYRNTTTETRRSTREEPGAGRWQVPGQGGSRKASALRLSGQQRRTPTDNLSTRHTSQSEAHQTSSPRIRRID